MKTIKPHYQRGLPLAMRSIFFSANSFCRCFCWNQIVHNYKFYANLTNNEHRFNYTFWWATEPEYWFGPSLFTPNYVKFLNVVLILTTYVCGFSFKKRGRVSTLWHEILKFYVQTIICYPNTPWLLGLAEMSSFLACTICFHGRPSNYKQSMVETAQTDICLKMWLCGPIW